MQYYRYAKSEIIAADKAKEATDLARERNEFRLARIEREKLERAQKHAERAAAGKAEHAKTEAVKPDVGKSDAEPPPNTAVGDDAKKAAIAAAIERAKALKLAAAQADAGAPKEKLQGNAVSAEQQSATNEQAQDNQTKAEQTQDEQTKDEQIKNEQAKKDKQAMIAAAIERAKAQKLAASQAGATPKNIENVSAAIQAEISDIDAVRAKAKTLADSKETDR